MAKRKDMGTVFNIIDMMFKSYWAMLSLLILGFVSIVGISLYRLNTDTSAKQEDDYAYAVIASSAIFNIIVYSLFIINIFYYSSYIMHNISAIIFILFILLLNPISLSLAIIGLNHSNLAYKEERSKTLWIMNIGSQVLFSFTQLILFYSTYKY